MATAQEPQPARTVTLGYFSDVLCIWAYLAQIKIDELREQFGDRVRIEPHFVSVFGNAAARIAERWGDKGGAQGYGAHVREVASRFDHVPVHPGIWTGSIPSGSAAVHAFVKAAELEGAGERGEPELRGRTRAEELTWRLRCAFFQDLRDPARLDVQCAIAEELSLPVARIRGHLEDGTALAALASDHDLAGRHQVTGSPTFLINDGRQKLYGNVGYLVIEANVKELLADQRNRASWC